MKDSFGLVNADIWTAEPRQPRAEALLVERGRIRSVGDSRAIASKAQRAGLPTVDLRGTTVVPGLIDSHTHLVHQGLLHERLDLWQTTSLAQALKAVQRRAKGHRGTAPLIVERWDETRWKERRFPTRDELDAISRTLPIILRRVDGHLAVGNLAACNLVAPRLPGVDPDTGLLLEEAALNLNQVFPTPLPDAVAALDAAQEQALRLGITTVHDFVVPSYLRAYQELHRRGRLRLRAHLSLYIDYLDAVERSGFSQGLGDDTLRFHGVKLFADGSFGGRTAALHEPYSDTPGSKGRLNYSDDQLADLVRRADAAGLPVSAHAIGDAAIDQVASALAALPKSGRRHRIEHFELHTEASVAAATRHRLVASMQPNFIGAWSRRGGMYHQRVGAERFRRTNEFRRLREAGVPLAFGSDCMPMDPWFGLQACLDAPFPNQRLPWAHALEAYTRGSAWGLGREPDLGSLRPGTYADFVVASIRPRKGGALARTRVDQTYVAGRRVAGRGIRGRRRP